MLTLARHSLSSEFPSSTSSTPSLSSGESKHDDDITNNTDADDEWNAVVTGFQMYKAAYDDLKVPLGGYVLFGNH